MTSIGEERNCSGWEERIALFVERDLEAAEAAEVERHLAGCERCRELLSGLERSQQSLKRVALEDADRSEYDVVRARVLSAIAAPRHRLPALPLWSWAVAAAVIAAVAAWLAFRQGPVHDMRPERVGPRVLGEAPARAASPAVAAPGLRALEQPHVAKALAFSRRAGVPAAPATPAEDAGSKATLIKLLTDDPDIVIYWIVDEDGGER